VKNSQNFRLLTNLYNELAQLAWLSSCNNSIAKQNGPRKEKLHTLQTKLAQATFHHFLDFISALVVTLASYPLSVFQAVGDSVDRQNKVGYFRNEHIFCAAAPRKTSR
jgi:hypothetical protein